MRSFLRLFSEVERLLMRVCLEGEREEEGSATEDGFGSTLSSAIGSCFVGPFSFAKTSLCLQKKK